MCIYIYIDNITCQPAIQPKNPPCFFGRCVSVFGTVGTCCPIGDLVQSENRCCCGFLGPVRELPMS